MSERKELPPNPSRLIEGLRDTGYEFNTALADIVDNSVDAGADRVDIWIRMDPEGDIEVTVADNGCGMDRTTLLDGMTYGATGRADPKRLGKFGLGLKTASTAFCRRLSVVSRPSSTAAPLMATWDLDHVEEVSKWELLIDSPPADLVETLDELAAGRAGTLVAWQAVDRVIKAYNRPTGAAARRALDRIIDDFRFHASMVYQRFLDPGDTRARDITMILNGEPVVAWDPFRRSEKGTELVAEESLDVELPDGTSAEFTVKAFILPRKEEFSSEAGWREARLKNDMQGIYVYRENRLIHPADWLGIFRKEPHLTLLRVEFSFDHRLDSAFKVDIKKSRILLDEELHKWLETEFIPAPRNAANERYRKGQRRKIDALTGGAHTGSSKNIESKEEQLRMSEIQVVDKATGEVDLTNRMGKMRLKLKLGEPTGTGEVTVRAVPGIDDGLLWEPALIGTHHAVSINSGHPYYGKVYVPNLASGVTIQGMDALLWALAEAELGTINPATRNHFRDLRFEVSRLLRDLVSDLPEPDLPGEEEEVG